MSSSLLRVMIALSASGACLVGGSSQGFAQSAGASLFICDVPATAGGCVNGTSSRKGFVTFDFSGFLPGDSFVGGLPATSPAQAAETGKIDFSFSWQTSSPGTNTPEKTIFFTEPNGLVADVLDYTSSVFGGAGRDFMNISGYVISLATPVTVAALAAQGITPTGSASATGLYEFTATDLTGTFQPGLVPELPTWSLLALGFLGLGLAAPRASRKRVCAAA